MNFFILYYWHDRNFKRKKGGPIKIFELSDNLIKLGHRVVLFAPKIGYPNDQTKAQVVEIPVPDIGFLRFPFFDFFLSMGLLFHTLKRKPDILYMRWMSSLWPLIISKFFSIPLIVEVNDNPYWSYTRFKLWSPKLFIWKVVDKLNFNLCKKLSVITNVLKERIHRNNKVPLEKMVMIESGANTSRFQPLNKEECCRKLGLEPTKNYVGYIGTFLEWKDLDTLIDSAPHILNKTRNTRFLIVGDGPMKDRWMEKVLDKGLSSYFIFTGFVPYEMAPIYINSMDVCTAPFLKRVEREVSPMKLFDYLACGKPVVTNVKPGNNVLIEKGAIILVPPEEPESLGNAIVRLLKNEELRIRMGKIGRKIVSERYNREEVARKVVSISKEVLC